MAGPVFSIIRFKIRKKPMLGQKAQAWQERKWTGTNASRE